MKLRIHANSVRFRLSRSEVARFQETGHIEDTIGLGPVSKFSYGLTSADTSTLSLTYDGSRLDLNVPRNLLHDWAASDQVAIAGEQAVENSRTLEILVEKDFQCLHKPTASDSDTYPNPLSATHGGQTQY